MTVNLTRIYTKLGDGGETHLGDMSRVPKTHPRIEAYGDVDELTALIGLALATGGLREREAGGAGRRRARRADGGVAATRAERAVRRRRGPVGAARPRRGAAAAARDGRVRRVARAGLRRGQRDARAAEVLRAAGRDARGRAPARVPHGLPARGAPRAARRERQPRGHPLPQPALGPPVHPQPCGDGGRGAALAAREALRPRDPIPMVPVDVAARDAALARQAQLVKPPGSLGRLEELAVWLAGVTGPDPPRIRAPGGVRAPAP